MRYFYILFPNHTSGLALERVIKKNEISYTITPTPRELSSCCGITIRLQPEDVEKVKRLITQHRIPIEGIKPLEVKSYFNI